MELINQTKTNFLIGKDKEGKDIFFRIGKVMKLDENLAKTLLRYEGIDTVDSLKDKAETIVNKAKSKK